MSRRIALHSALRAAALLAVLLLVALLLLRPVQHYFNAASEVQLYQKYAQAALWTPPELPAEYPPLSVAFFVVPQLTFPQHYLEAFCVMAALATWVVALIVDKLSGAGWKFVWLVVLGAWATFGSRYDMFVVLFTVLAFAACIRRRWLSAQALLALGVALKFYPLVLMPLVVVWQWRVTGRLPLRAVAGGGLGLLLAVGSMWLADPGQFRAILEYHAARPIQIEALAASLVWLLGPVAGEVSYGSLNLLSPSSNTVVTLLTALNGVLLLGIYGAVLAGKLRPAASWALVLLVAVGTSKVFSTQYLLWVIPIVVLAFAEQTVSRPAAALTALWSIICALTSAVYPLGLRIKLPFGSAALTGLDEHMVTVTLRNGLWVAFVAFAAFLWFARTPKAPISEPDGAAKRSFLY